MKILIAVDIEGISGGANGRRARPHDQRLRVRATVKRACGNCVATGLSPRAACDAVRARARGDAALRSHIREPECTERTRVRGFDRRLCPCAQDRELIGVVAGS